MSNIVTRYSPTLDWGACYYEGDEPSASMEESLYGEWVEYSEYQALHNANKYLVDINEQLFSDIKQLQKESDALQAKLDALMLEFTPDEMTQDQLRKYSEHQRPI